MEENKRFTWTVSVIAMVDRNEGADANNFLQWDAYNEFEDSITTLETPTKDIRFVIYLYDVMDERAYVKQSEINGDRYCLSIKEYLKLPNFHDDPTYQHLINFFENHVTKAKTKEDVSPEELHRHMLIVWGHAAGLGFLKSALKAKMQKSVDKLGLSDLQFSRVMDSLQQDAHNVSTLNFLISQLSLKAKPTQNEAKATDHKSIKTNFFKNINGAFNLSLAEDEISDDYFKVISAADLNHVIDQGLQNDKSIPAGSKRIEVMLCLSCYVNMIEVAYALRQTVSTYIAPQTTISFYGYNYRQLFKLLTLRPQSSNRDIAVNITDYYLAKYLEPPVACRVDDSFTIGTVNYKYDVCFSAVDLSGYENVVAVMKSFKMMVEEFAETDTIINKYCNYKISDALKEAERRCRNTSKAGTTDIGILDYYNLITECFSLFDSDSLNTYSLEIANMYATAQIISTYNPGILSQRRMDLLTSNFTSQSPGSFSVFLPNQNFSVYEKQLEAINISLKNANEFIANSGWDYIYAIVVNA